MKQMTVTLDTMKVVLDAFNRHDLYAIMIGIFEVELNEKVNISRNRVALRTEGLLIGLAEQLNKIK